MEDLKKMTVRALRDLARKHLGTDEARLKTREDLVKALKGAVKGTLEKAAASAETSRAKRVASSLKSSAAKAVATAKRVATKGGKALGKKTENGRHEPPGAVPRKGGGAKPVKLVKFARSGRAKAPEAAAAPATPAHKAARAAEPVVEGFFVARVAGEEEARKHHLTEEQSGAPREGHRHDVYDEKLGELPSHYGDDTALLLPRDPHTLFFLWDFKDETREGAAAGLDGARAVLRVFDGAHLVKELDFALESHSYYLHDLEPGKSYRVEAHFVGKDGRSRRVGVSSNVIALPPDGPSSNTEVRFLRVPWGLPLSRLKEFLRDGRARIGAYGGEKKFLDLSRTQLPHSATLAGERGEGVFSSSEHGWSPPRSGNRSGRGR